MHELLKLCIPGVIGGIIGGCLAPSLQHKFAQWRDREAREHNASADKEVRKREFVAFLQKWRSEVASFAESLHQVGDAAYYVYRPKLSEFLSWVSKVQDVFTDRQTFQRLADRLSGLDAKDWKNKNPREVILEAIDALSYFIEHT